MMTTVNPALTSMYYDMNMTMNGTDMSVMNGTMTSMVLMSKTNLEIYRENAYEVGQIVLSRYLFF